MTTLKEIEQQIEEVRQLIDACQGKLRVRIDTVTHGHGGRSFLPHTACGIRWIPNIAVPQAYPMGVPTKDPVNCMTCLVAETRS